MNGESWTIGLLLQPSVSGVAVSLFMSGLTVDILSTFCGVVVDQCAKLTQRTFLWFDGFVYCQNVHALCGTYVTEFNIFSLIF